jgi:hypothetical protein
MRDKIALGAKLNRHIGPDETLERVDADGMVLLDRASGVCVYYQDKGKRFRFLTDPQCGMPLLRALCQRNQVCLERNLEMIQARVGTDPKAVQRMKDEGLRIYTDKPTLKSAKNVTWSDDECE